MNEKTLFKPAVLSLTIVAIVVLSFEIYLRNHGAIIDYDDGEALWANNRSMVYEPADKSLVFIGSSRIKYDLDLATWKGLTKVHAIQLAMEGSSPRPVLTDLANDLSFKGNVIIDVTEGLFFSMAPPFMETPIKNIKYYHDQTPAQKVSFELHRMVESQLVILNKDYYSLNAQLDQLQLQSRPGVFMMPIFPMNFDKTTFERQEYMTDSFVENKSECDQVKNIWAFFAKMGEGAPPTPPEVYDGIFAAVKADVDKIKLRGGSVLFVRTPSSGPYFQGENMEFPKDKFWDRLLKETNSPGIHFKDYPAMANFDCPEFSHLKLQDAVIFTQLFFEELLKHPGFSYLKSNNSSN